MGREGVAGGDGSVEANRGLRGRIGLVAGPAVLLLVLSTSPPPELGPEGWRAAGVGLWMAIWWVTEAVPIPATALVPLAAFPPLGVAGVQEAAAPYANPIIFLFLGGFLLALGMERWGLPRRVALAVVHRVGVEPRAVVAGFMASAAFLSMWVSNTATAMIMLPIGASVMGLVEGGDEAAAGAPDRPTSPPRNFGICLMLGIAYACSIGGVATLIGTPPNAFLAGFFSETYGVEVGFARWMLFGAPLAAVGLPLVHQLLTRWIYPIRLERIPGGRQFVASEREAMGAISAPERRVAVVFGAVAAAWILRPLLERWVPGLSDAGIAVAGGLVLFLLPAGADPGPAAADGGREPLLRWGDAAALPWGVLVLFGGGLSLASAVQETGLTAWIGGATGALAAYPVVLVVGVTAAVVVLLTELTSNTATSAALLPVLASVAVGAGHDPRLLAVTAAVAASCAFMLPVATPPNAIVYGSGAVSVPEMARAGAWLNLLFVVLVSAAALLWLPVALGVQPGVVPGWAG
jgi:sodium-dependent dicarboxylate transporter 2/3/5